ncbi:hypothetical protein [Kineococcus gypseus]|uniref:hypothetical protein n=1 Tax=Kineococcus gypseus TaxID=1637102 RepID=UPI003D7CB6AD
MSGWGRDEEPRAPWPEPGADRLPDAHDPYRVHEPARARDPFGTPDPFSAPDLFGTPDPFSAPDPSGAPAPPGPPQRHRPGADPAGAPLRNEVLGDGYGYGHGSVPVAGAAQAVLWTAVGGLLLVLTGTGWIAAVVALAVAPGARRRVLASGGARRGLGHVLAGKVVAWATIALTVLLVVALVALLRLLDGPGPLVPGPWGGPWGGPWDGPWQGPAGGAPPGTTAV